MRILPGGMTVLKVASRNKADAVNWSTLVIICAGQWGGK